MTDVSAGGTIEAAPPQHMVALARANQVRFGHAALKREIRAGRLTALDALDDPRAERMRVETLLNAQPLVGKVRARRFLEDLDLLYKTRISPERQVRQLTQRQRRALAQALEARGD
jgi:hypothetical protein